MSKENPEDTLEQRASEAMAREIEEQRLRSTETPQDAIARREQENNDLRYENAMLGRELFIVKLSRDKYEEQIERATAAFKEGHRAEASRIMGWTSGQRGKRGAEKDRVSMIELTYEYLNMIRPPEGLSAYKEDGSDLPSKRKAVEILANRHKKKYRACAEAIIKTLSTWEKDANSPRQDLFSEGMMPPREPSKPPKPKTPRTSRAKG
jgi:hypothetical protein